MAGSAARKSVMTSGRNAKRNHGIALPPQAEFIGHFVARQTFGRGQGLLEAVAYRLAQWRTQIGVAQQDPQPIVDDPFDQLLQFGQAQVGDGDGRLGHNDLSIRG